MFAEILLAAWVTVGEPGNPPPAGQVRGTVDYTYQISDQLVTTQQLVDFLNASGAPYTPPPYDDIANFERSGDAFVAKPGMELAPAKGLDPLTAMRYVNWIETGGQSTESGTYELVGLPQVEYVMNSPDGVLMMMHLNKSALNVNPAAKYRLPTMDEVAKAMPLLHNLTPFPGREIGQLVGVQENFCISKSCYGSTGMWAGMDDGWSGVPIRAQDHVPENLYLRLMMTDPDGPVTVYSDTDLDGDVDSSDLLAFLQDWTGQREPARTWTSRSDVNRDGDVDSDDLLGFLENWSGAAGATRAVPEPSGLVLVFMGFAACYRSRFREHRRVVK